MISMGDLEETDQPGYFMLAELGVAIGTDVASLTINRVV